MIIGTLLFVAFLVLPREHNSFVALIGFVYLVVCAIASICIIGVLVYRLTTSQTTLRSFCVASGMLVTAIVIGVLYVATGVKWINNIYLFVDNSSKDRMINIQLNGISTEKLMDLAPGEYAFAYIPIPGEGHLSITYNDSRGLEEETIVGYLSGADGGVILYSLGNPANQILPDSLRIQPRRIERN